MSNGRSPRYPVNGSSHKKVGLMEVNEVGEDCPSFIDDLDFEEHPDTDTANRQSNITEGGPTTEMMQQPISYSNVKQNNYNAIVRKVPKDPLKNSLFHNIHT